VAVATLALLIGALVEQDWSNSVAAMTTNRK